MTKSILLALLFSTGLFSQNLAGSFVGFNGNSSTVAQIDFGLKLFQNGYTSYGAHISADFQSALDETVSTGQTTSKVKESAGGVSLGAYADFGRAVMMAGASFITEKDKLMRVDNSGFNNLLQYQDVKKMGGYIKVGYKIKHILFYGGFNTYYKATAGIGYTF